MPLILAILQVLPQLVQTGFNVSALVSHAVTVAAPASPVESFAASLLSQLPALIASGVDIMTAVTNAKTQVEAMLAAKRDPTQAEWDALNAQIKALQGQLHST